MIMMEFVFKRVENIVENRDAVYQHTLLFTYCLQNAYSSIFNTLGCVIKSTVKPVLETTCIKRPPA